MNKGILTSIIILTLSTFNAGAQADTTLRALEQQQAGIWKVAAPLYANPALNQWRMNEGYSAVDVAWNGRHDGKTGAVNPFEGKSANAFSGGAETYTKYRNSTLSGRARYSNGRRNDVRWCETSSPELIYPYFSADSIGGDFHSETYSFGGSYADHYGRWGWGGSLAYDAILEYRDIDPRPKNVSGILDAALAVAYRAFGNYWASIGVDFRRYTQSNDIEFKSEMGVDKIFHLTGGNNHYSRFGGSGLESHFRGYRYGFDAALCPENGSGAFARVHVSRFTFDKILTELNKLPLAGVGENSLEATAGYMKPTGQLFWGAAASFSTLRRHGHENIFGDPAGNVYPQIASLDMYGRNASDAVLTLAGGFHCGIHRLMLTLRPRYRYSSEVYVSPRYLNRTHAFAPDARLDYSSILNGKWLFEANVAYTANIPFNCIYSPGTYDSQMRQLALINEQLFLEKSRFSSTVAAGASATRMLNLRIGIRLNAAYTQSSFCRSLHSHSWSISAGLVF